MPKEIQHISDFSGGNRVVRTIPGIGNATGMDIATSEVDVRDVLDNELVDMIDCEVVEDGKIALTKAFTVFGDSVPEAPEISLGRGLSVINSDYDGAQNPKGFREQNTDLPDFSKSEYILVGSSNDGAVAPAKVIRGESWHSVLEWGDVSVGLDDQDLEGMTDFQLEMVNVDNAVIISDANFDNDRTSIPAKYGFVNYAHFPAYHSGSQENQIYGTSQAYWRGFYKGDLKIRSPQPFKDPTFEEGVSDILFGDTDPRHHPSTYFRPGDVGPDGITGEEYNPLGNNGGVGVKIVSGNTTPGEGGGFPGYWQFGMTYIYGNGINWDLDTGTESSIYWGLYANGNTEAEMGEGDHWLLPIGYGLFQGDADGTSPTSIKMRFHIKNFQQTDFNYGTNDIYTDFLSDQRFRPAIDKRMIGSRIYIREWKLTDSGEYSPDDETERCFCEARFTQNMPKSWIDGQEGSEEDWNQYFSTVLHNEQLTVPGGIRKRGEAWTVVPEGTTSADSNIWPWYVSTATGSLVYTRYLEVVNYEELIDTYESINGYKSGDLIDFTHSGDGWKTSDVHSNRFFIANVKIDGSVYPDTIYKGIPDKGVLFLRDSYITVASEDADEIVCIKAYNNKLLCFKEKSLYIFDISEFDNEKLEETKHGLGTDHPSSVVETPYGIAWKSSGGIVYLYDGSDVLDLTVNKDSNSVYFTSMWAGNFLQDHQIGYDPSFDELVLISRETEVVDTEDSVMPFSPLLKYKFKNGYWSYTRAFGAALESQMEPARSGGLNNILLPTKGGGGDRDPDPPDIPDQYYPSYDPIFWKKTNFIWTSGSLFGYGSPRIICCSSFKYFGADYTLVWGLANFPPSLDASPCNRGSMQFEFSTKEFDLGSPDVRKKIYKVYVSYKNPVEQAHEDGGLYPPKLFIALNGKSSHNIEEDPSPNWVSLGEFDKTSLSDGWVRKEFIVKNSTDVPQHDYNKAITAQLKVARSAYPLVDYNEDVNVLTNPGFEVNDMSIVYRSKPIK